MRIFGKTYLILFVFNTIFMLFFYGFYILYQIHYPSNEYEWVSFVGFGSPHPSKTEILFNGFRSIYSIAISATIAFIVILLAQFMKTFKPGKRNFLLILYTSFSWTVLFVFLRLTFIFIWDRSVLNYKIPFLFEITMQELPVLATIYFITVFPFTAILYKMQITRES